MHIDGVGEFDPDLDFQLIDCGGLLEVYALGQKTGGFQIGEIAMRNIKAKIVDLTDYEAQQLVQSYCDTASRIREHLASGGDG